MKVTPETKFKTTLHTETIKDFFKLLLSELLKPIFCAVWSYNFSSAKSSDKKKGNGIAISNKPTT